MRNASGLIQVRRDGDGYSLLLTMPGLAGWLVSRETLADALRALADHLERADAYRATVQSRGDA